MKNPPKDGPPVARRAFSGRDVGTGPARSSYPRREDDATGFITEQHLAQADETFPGILASFAALATKPRTFLDLVVLFEGAARNTAPEPDHGQEPSSPAPKPTWRRSTTSTAPEPRAISTARRRSAALSTLPSMRTPCAPFGDTVSR